NGQLHYRQSHHAPHALFYAQLYLPAQPVYCVRQSAESATTTASATAFLMILLIVRQVYLIAFYSCWDCPYLCSTSLKGCLRNIVSIRPSRRRNIRFQEPGPNALKQFLFYLPQGKYQN